MAWANMTRVVCLDQESQRRTWCSSRPRPLPVGDVRAAALREPGPHPVGRGRGDQPEHADRHAADEPHDAERRREDPGPLPQPLRRQQHGRSSHRPRPGHESPSRFQRRSPPIEPAVGGPEYPAAMSVIDWLLDGDPAIRWQVLRDLGNAFPDEVAAERARVVHDGWAARLLALEGPDGLWEGGACFPASYTGGEPGQPWTPTMHTLQTLQLFGLDPASESARRAIALVARNGRWEHAGQRYFDGEVEPCINGRTIATGAYFGVDVAAIVERILGEQLSDGGWNCEAENGSVRSSFHTTICVLEGLLEHERATGGSAEVTAARVRGQEYLLERRMFRSLSTGEVVRPEWTLFSFPTRWHYDVLRGLDYLRSADVEPDERCAEAVGLVEMR